MPEEFENATMTGLFLICVWKKHRQGNHDYREVNVFKTLFSKNVFRSHENAKPAFSNSSGLKSVFEKLRLRDGLVWTVGLIVEVQPRYQISPA